MFFYICLLCFFSILYHFRSVILNVLYFCIKLYSLCNFSFLLHLIHSVRCVFIIKSFSCFVSFFLLFHACVKYYICDRFNFLVQLSIGFLFLILLIFFTKCFVSMKWQTHRKQIICVFFIMCPFIIFDKFLRFATLINTLTICMQDVPAD